MRLPRVESGVEHHASIAARREGGRECGREGEERPCTSKKRAGDDDDDDDDLVFVWSSMLGDI